MECGVPVVTARALSGKGRATGRRAGWRNVRAVVGGVPIESILTVGDEVATYEMVG
jgi:hypothetical protein